MKARYWLWLALIVLGAAGLGGLLLSADSRKLAMPPLSDATDMMETKQLQRAAEARLFFAHMSVGENILSGVQTLYTAKGVVAPRLVQVTLGRPADAPEGGVILHAAIGENGNPLGKLRNFDAALRAGLADQVDVALLKFCYIDFGQDTDVDALFGQYRTTLDALQRDYPRVTFLHSTAPLMVAPNGIKSKLMALLGKDDNQVRGRYNTLVRQTFGTSRLVDVAAIESSAPGGAPSTGALYQGFSSDEGHLNETGSAIVAAGLVRMLASTV